jgi:hypothetical protein
VLTASWNLLIIAESHSQCNKGQVLQVGSAILFESEIMRIGISNPALA